MPKEKYTITLIRPEGVSVDEMKAHINDAVRSWGGQFEPPNENNNFIGDPLFPHLENTVTRQTRRAKKS